MSVDLLNEKYEFSFTEKDFNDLRALITKKTGIELPDNKKSLLYSRLVRRVRHHKLSSFQEYHNLVEKEIKHGKDHELISMINAMTTNVTHFFREHHHFEHLTKTLKKIAEEKETINIWSAASSIGAEPWSIAFTVEEFKKDFPKTSVNIYASDIDSSALQKAREATYALDEKEFIKSPLLRKYLSPLKTALTEEKTSTLTQNIKQYTVIPSMKNKIKFFQANLMEEWSPKLPTHIDVIFCRNVIIYFGKETKQELFKKFAQKQKEGDTLYIGHSESLMDITDRYTSLGKTMYTRNKKV